MNNINKQSINIEESQIFINYNHQQECYLDIIRCFY